MSAFRRSSSSCCTFGGVIASVRRLVAALYVLSILERASFMVISLSMANLTRADNSRYAGQIFESEMWFGLEQLMHFCEHTVVRSWDSSHFLHLLSLLVQWFFVCLVLQHFLQLYGLG